MQVTINFNDEDDPEEKISMFFKAVHLKLALGDVREKLRQHEKYGASPLTRESFNEILNDRGLLDLDI